MNKIIIISFIHTLVHILVCPYFFAFLSSSHCCYLSFVPLAPFYPFFLLSISDLRFLLYILGSTLHLRTNFFPSLLVSPLFSLHILLSLLFPTSDLRSLLCILGNTIHLRINFFPFPMVSRLFSLHTFLSLLFPSLQFFGPLVLSLVHSLPFPFFYIFHDNFAISFQYVLYLYLYCFNFWLSVVFLLHCQDRCWRIILHQKLKVFFHNQQDHHIHHRIQQLF